MAVNVLFAAGADRWQSYEAPLTKALGAAGVQAVLGADMPADQVDYIVYAPDSALQDFRAYTRAKAVLNLWAGVEGIVDNDTLTIPLTRMVDHGLRQGMIDWVTGHVLRHHLNIDLHIKGQDGIWRRDVPPLANDRRVSLLGLGALGASCGSALAGLGFEVTGWSRRPKSVPGLRCLSGSDGLTETLGRAEILVLLLPHTPQTENILNADSLTRMPRGAIVINPGRGPLIDDAALLAALDSGQIGHATLDVFRIEPLPSDHPYWHHENVTVTPHIASETRPETAAQVIAENIRRSEAAEPLLHLVDRATGY